MKKRLGWVALVLAVCLGAELLAEAAGGSARRASVPEIGWYSVKASPEAIPFYQKRTHDLYGVGIDAVPALDCWALYFPGFQGMKLRRVPEGRLSFTARGAATPGQPPSPGECFAKLAKEGRAFFPIRFCSLGCSNERRHAHPDCH